jgi:hypothetical protein
MCSCKDPHQNPQRNCTEEQETEWTKRRNEELVLRPSAPGLNAYSGGGRSRQRTLGLIEFGAAHTIESEHGETEVWRAGESRLR